MGTNNVLVKLFDRYFQEEVDKSMCKFEQVRKDSTITLSVFEDFSHGFPTMVQS